MIYSPIVGTLIYIVDVERQRVLLVHRNARPDDEHLGKYNGLGGKLESHEDVVEGIRREVREEAGIELLALSLRGTVNWPGFGVNGEDWLGFIFRSDAWAGEPLSANEEGTLSWEPLRALLAGELPIWEGDRHFLPLVFDDDARAFHGVMPYSGGRPTGWSYSRL